MAPRLSVVVPFYNVHRYIRDCLQSLRKQTFSDFEVILVDDGSEDESASIAQSYVDRDNRFRIVRQANGGLGPARNAGTDHAQGEYLSFVDSDDLVGRFAFEVMIRSLDESGSSFAAGNARRFDSTGVRESYVHRTAFAQDRPATHVSEYPELAIDRMVWNKMFRRAFWDEFGYRFPAIRYEDYPVTLRAHLDAVTVDCLSVPVYYWRVREFGQSITQSSHEYTNLSDRVASADLVLDLVQGKRPEIRTRVHRHLAETDLVALAQAFASVPADHEQLVLDLGRRLLDRLQEDVVEQSSRYNRLQFSALRSADVDLLRRLADYRSVVGRLNTTRARRRSRRPWRFELEFPGLDDSPGSVPRRLYRIPQADLQLQSSLTRVWWEGDRLCLGGVAEIRHLTAGPSFAIAVSLESERRVVPCDVLRFAARDSRGDVVPIGFEARADVAAFAGFAEAGREVNVIVEVVDGRIARRGRLCVTLPGSAQSPPGRWINEQTWAQPKRGSDGCLVIELLRQPPRLVSATARVDAFEIEGVLPLDDQQAEVQLTNPFSAGTVVALHSGRYGHTSSFRARVAYSALTEPASWNDPFTATATHSLHYVGMRETRALIATGIHESVVAQVGKRMLTLTRTAGNRVAIIDAPIRLTADSASLETESRLSVSGYAWQQGGSQDLFWRRFLPDGTTREVDAHVKVCEDRWQCQLTLDASLIPIAKSPAPESEDSGQSPEANEWTLFCACQDAEPVAVSLDPIFATQLPAVVVGSDVRAVCTPRSGRLHVLVEPSLSASRFVPGSR